MSEKNSRSTLDKRQNSSQTTDQSLLLDWYHKNHRKLPWRENRDAYRIWISETMLQQTTTTAVLGFYQKFLTRFPTLDKLAASSIEDVYEMWAGLGYYSRARNLHAAAQALAANKGFPQTYKELMEYPGFGPYTARAVSSFAFLEQVGVLDGNVIRVFSRKNNLAVEWWRPQVRSSLQEVVDKFVTAGPSHELNQALMELGSQICTPKSPHCIMCPWMHSCAARKAGSIAERPLRKPKRESEIWLWSPRVEITKNKILLERNAYAPFLQKAWILPGEAKRASARPERYDFRHSITHHDIYVHLKNKNRVHQVNKKAKLKKNTQQLPEQIWVEISQVNKYAPASLVKKAIHHVLRKQSDPE